MGDFKSKLPDLQELGSMTSKLFNGLKNSITEIVRDYKKKREVTETQPSEEATPSVADNDTETPVKSKKEESKPE